MLKMSADPQERVGGALMESWGGSGAARVLARDNNALLTERASGTRSLAAMSRSGDDAAACRILCATARDLRTPRSNPPPELTPLATRFRDLVPAAAERGFDCANLFCNPDLSDPVPPVATLPHVFQSRMARVADGAALERGRLLQWVLAWAGLSAAWIIESGEAPAVSLAVAQLAAAELDR